MLAHRLRRWHSLIVSAGYIDTHSYFQLFFSYMTLDVIGATDYSLSI